jgi:hypothetical protein
MDRICFQAGLIVLAITFGANPPMIRADSPAGPRAALWVSTFKTPAQRPVEVARVGKGQRNILFVGSIYGNEPESIELMDEICQLARGNPPPEGLTILLVRTPNPDGLVDHIHTNLNGVDLNRNFPSRRFTLAPTRLTGPRPASEPEIQYMLRILQEYQPIRIIHIRSGGGERPLVLFNEKWLANGIEGSLPNGVSQGRYAATFKAGSLEEYASLEMGTEIATVYQATQGGRKLQAAELLRCAVAHLPSTRGASPLAGSVESNNVEQPPATPPQDHDGQKGDVEMLPPPSEFVTSRKIDQEVDRSDARYQELPPPPR